MTVVGLIESDYVMYLSCVKYAICLSIT